jgi:hypothetical protein
LVEANQKPGVNDERLYPTITVPTP